MKLSFVQIVMFLIIVFITTSCYRKCPCNAAALPIQFVSFSPRERDTLIVRQFIKGTNFQTIKDTALIDSTNSSYINMGDDVMELSANSSLSLLSGGFDYEVYIPSLNRVWQISELTEQYEQGLCARCFNHFSSFIKDGQIIHSGRLYITK